MVTFLLVDQLLALTTPFSSGFGLLLFLAALAISAVPNLMKQNNLIARFKNGIKPSNVVLPLLIITYSILGATNAPCHGHWFFSLATVFLVIYSWKFLEIYTRCSDFKQIIEPKHALVGLFIVYFCLCMSVNGYDIYSILQGGPTNRPSGLYLEPSHLILYASPLIFTAISNHQTRAFGILLTVFIFVLAFTLTYVALAGLIILYYLIHYQLTKHKFANSKNLLLVFLAVTIFAATFNGSYITDRMKTDITDRMKTESVVGSERKNLTTLVYLNGWLLAKATIENTSGIGLGLGAMGCSEVINNDEQTLSAEVKRYTGNIKGKIISVRDGSFLAAKIISELGLLGMCLIAFVFYKIILNLLKMINFEFDLILTGSMCLIMMLFFLRGLPYFSAPIVFCLILMFHYKKVLNRP